MAERAEVLVLVENDVERDSKDGHSNNNGCIDDVALHLLVAIIARDDGVVVDGEVKAEAGTTKTFMAGDNNVVVNDSKLTKKAIISAARAPAMLAIV